MFPMLAGRVNDRLLPLMVSLRNPVRDTTAGGIEPAKLLRFTDNAVSPFKADREAGNIPVRILELSHRALKAAMDPMLLGMD